MVNDLYERKYRKEECYWGLKPSPIVTEILKYKKGDDVLDLGCGEGRNALYLVKNGFNVTGVDISKTGIKKFLHLADKMNVKVKGIVSDISTFKFNKKFDIILSIAILHFLNRDNIIKIIKKIKQHTKIEGLNVITVFTEDNPYKGFKYLFKKNELKKFYEDWNVIYYNESITPLEKHGGEKPHRHAVATLIAQNS